MEEDRDRIDEERELQIEIEEKNKKLLEQININETAMGYNVNRQERYTEQDRKRDREKVQINNIEGD